MNKGNAVCSEETVAKLIEMGFDKSKVVRAVKNVGLSIDDGVEYILNECRPKSTDRVISSPTSSTTNFKASGQKRQSSILDHFRLKSTAKKTAATLVEERAKPLADDNCRVETLAESFPVYDSAGSVIGSDWEQRANSSLKKHFGFPSLKSFQREALAAWMAGQDCLVLAATGSGKSMCFQIPALLTGKVVVVISPLISLMHDQCLKLAKHGISACFLGSGQPDSTVENKAMRGVYSVIYVCPETVLRLIQPLQRLAENRGIALFAIDEVHCVSKWGHDFRPDYRRLSVLRENFSASKLDFLESNIPLMALTATATIQVRGDILESLSMSKETKVVVTSFFRPNLRFSVKHSRTSSAASYTNDFQELIDTYTRKQNPGEKKNMNSIQELNSADNSSLEADGIAKNNLSDNEDDDSDIDDQLCSKKKNGSRIGKGKEMSVEYLENEVDVFRGVDDWDVAFGEFCAQAPHVDCDIVGESEIVDPPNTLEERWQLLKESLELGPTIIYVPTRKETLKIANYLCGCGVKAGAYHAALPKSHLRQVHKEFHENTLEVVVATIAFGMGIDKLNVRRIIHYGWPQSLEAYYQEAGRAGRDGKLSDCILIANLTRTPSLLPSKRSEEQTRQAYKMLTDCFRYVMNSSCCRAKKLVEYFGEEFSHEKCLVCDVCNNGPPEMLDLKEEAGILMQVIAAYHARKNSDDGPYYESPSRQQRITEKPNLRMFVSKIREQSQKFMETDRLWWQGLARIMEGKGLIREGDEKTHVQVKFPEPTKLGLEFLESMEEQAFHVHPEADMLLSVVKKFQPFSRFSDWGKGWADPEIRRQRLERMKSKSERSSSKRKPRKPRNRRPNLGTVRGRLIEKMSRKKD